MSGLISTAALVGNGLSIAYNENLSMSGLTRDILARITDQGGGTDARDSLLSLAKDAGAEADFEQLFSPLDDMGELAQRTRGMVSLAAQPSEARKHLEGVTRFFQDVRRAGVSHALEQIDDYAEAREAERAGVDDFLSCLAESSSVLTIANLNYDALVLSACLSLFPARLCDMSDGRNPGARVIRDGGLPYRCLPLRQDRSDLAPGGWADQEGFQVRLLHLHGSLAWLREPGTRKVFSFNMSDIRSMKFWRAWREERTQWQPVVVLTNQERKDLIVRSEPFAYGYAAFMARLINADRWCIAGYSFRDACVNDMLADAWQWRRKSFVPIMVVTHGPTPSSDDVLAAIKYDRHSEHFEPNDFLRVHHGGIENAGTSTSWKEWLEAVDLSEPEADSRFADGPDHQYDSSEQDDDTRMMLDDDVRRRMENGDYGEW